MKVTAATTLATLFASSNAFVQVHLDARTKFLQAAGALPMRSGVQSMKASVAAPVELDTAALSRVADESRGLAMDSIAAAESGHLGLPLGAAEIGAVLWGQGHLSYNPEDPQWLNRDRFVLSAGHGSMFVYSWLHLSGYDLPMEEVKNFRQWHSKTPGHPEFPSSQHNTPGIESTTGPLGQGVANAVGMAAASKMAAAKYNTDDHKIIDNHIIALCGDGCIQEGVVAEAAAFAAHEGMDNLIVMYDSNDVTLDKMAEFTQSEDVAQRFDAYGWEVVTIDGHDIASVSKTVADLKGSKNGKPKLVVCKTIIGKGIDEVAGTNAAHGEAGVAYVDGSREKLGLPADQKWFVSEDTRAYMTSVKDVLKGKYDDWQATYKAWQAANPDLAKELGDAIARKTPSAEEILAAIPEFPADANIATRQAGADVLQPIADLIPNYISGSADLHSSNKNLIKNGGDFGRGNGKSYTGRNVYYGIREHAMGSILNGFAYYGLWRVSGSTFLVFADYMRAPVRVAALSELPVGYIWTHDSVGVGEDGPTHQPVETVSSMRVMPNLDVIRPADAEETAGAFAASIERLDGPTALILTRQNVRNLKEVPIADRRNGVLKGAYVAKKESGDLKLILMGSGSEVQHLMDAAAEIGDGVRVVSVPCMERFDRQSQSYKDEVLPPACTNRMSMEAGVTSVWYKYIGMNGKALGVDEFGFSAPGDIVLREKGMTKEKALEVAKSMM